jgi:hypothetical protein
MLPCLCFLDYASSRQVAQVFLINNGMATTGTEFGSTAGGFLPLFHDVAHTSRN